MTPLQLKLIENLNKFHPMRGAVKTDFIYVGQFEHDGLIYSYVSDTRYKPGEETMYQIPVETILQIITLN